MHGAPELRRRTGLPLPLGYSQPQRGLKRASSERSPSPRAKPARRARRAPKAKRAPKRNERERNERERNERERNERERRRSPCGARDSVFCAGIVREWADEQDRFRSRVCFLASRCHAREARSLRGDSRGRQTLRRGDPRPRAGMLGSTDGAELAARVDHDRLRGSRARRAAEVAGRGQTATCARRVRWQRNWRATNLHPGAPKRRAARVYVCARDRSRAC
jgi:hypothetical protein